MRQALRLLIVIIFVMTGLKSSSQNLLKPVSNNYLRCYTVEQIKEFRKTHPNAETDNQFEAWLSKKIEAGKLTQRPASNFTIPIIFHIVHNGEAVGTSPNLDALLINEQLLQLNKDFANTSNSPYGSSAATGIQFVLAQKDTLNNVLAEPGINRINRTVKGWTDYATGWTPTYIDGTVKPSSIWDATKYFNVWIIPNLNNGTFDLLGYATFPSTSTLTGLNNNETASTAGIVILTATVGSAFLPNSCGIGYGLGKTLTHEAGHFFGLRHIWGDTQCGTDYCNDTPVHFGANSGVNTHPKSNSCGTPDEMFENYMDYSDDIILNTFTTDQVSRMQTVMLNSPRRVTLASSPVGGITVTSSNKISFLNCTGVLNVSEAGTMGTYPRYKDIDLTLNVQDKATGAATVTIVATGTAVNNYHYQLMTPTLTFAAGDASKNVKIRIFDNAEVDGNKTILLNYSISGAGVTAGSTAKSVSINIKDNDYMTVGNNIVTLLNQDFGTSGGAFPPDWLSGSFKSPAGINKWRVGSNGGPDITGQSLYITNNIITKPLEYSVDSVSDAVVVTPKINTVGYTNAALSFRYKCKGETGFDNGRLMFSYNNSSFYFLTDALGKVYTYQDDSLAVNTGNIMLPGVLQDTAFTIGFRWANDDNTGTNPPFLIDDVLITATPFPIETAVSNSFGYDIRTGTNVNNFKSTNNRAIATIKNVSENVSGVMAQITEAGAGNVAFNTSAGTFMRSKKVFKISPVLANGTVTYQATLFFTAAELAVWGADRLNLKIMKVKDGVPLNTTLNLSNAEIITPTVFEDVAGGYVSYTGNFTGFSQFTLVSPLASLPVAFISFQATPLQKNIQLLWTTAQEINNRGFIIERSLDGINFTQVGWVNGNGTTPLTSTYYYTDNYVQRNITYYYRLRQVDIDNRQVYSPVRNARLKPGAGISISISPNPAREYANLFITGTSNKATIELINTSGQKLMRQTDVNAFNEIYNLPLRGLAKGVYTVVVYLPEGAFAKKIIVQ